MGIAVLIFEILYYALFMKVAKKGKSTIGYLLAFTIATAVNILLRSTELYTYILFIYISLILINYLTKDKTGMSDIITLIAMMMVKIIIEGATAIALYQLAGFSIILTTGIFTVLKFLFILVFQEQIYKFNKEMNKKWNRNDFNIRYITTALVLGYTIISILVLIVK
jgi:hypothetical protein